MDFYHTPTSCSQATHILLREAKLDFRPHRVDIFNRTLEDGSDYTRINPNGYVPALVLDDGMLLTENVAILDWIASQADGLPPTGRLGRTRHLQMLGFISTELHKPCIPLFFIEDAEQQSRIRDLLSSRFRRIGSMMAGDHLFGDRFTGADAFLYVMLRWAAMLEIATPKVFDAFVDRVEQRPAVQAALAAEAVSPLHADVAECA
ncbi:glutathione S-transferase C-terminal domain-containing protein [Paracoccus spongiarum]|uniref:Glutathione S-transferase N-terminal domain-containing protein n=1 Tax=Paracoccus spongiarum TaxID=3064387 RepID=A0ABT9JDI6_9RHOB|nr:glutathione S-transferase C-terminal domain-containing protein [Paracoccus sp. 2205BS29-5]MDP5307887.1 glutathione S-transferase N-terminal domain-containing protein [Paracoccus sp. 2205BS29-5]